jgi:catechol 2,3-dioxygenase-like lactoylglutathione lyase family enzyme
MAQANGGGQAAGLELVYEMKIEVVVLPVSDVDRAKEFYGRLGWRLDADRAAEGFRLVQFTPPGSECSIQFGLDLTTAAPGSVKNLHLAVVDVQAVRAMLAGRGVEVSEVFHCETATSCRFDTMGPETRVSGPDPHRTSYFSFATFSDPDGNGWVFQEVTARLAGRI